MLKKYLSIALIVFLKLLLVTFSTKVWAMGATDNTAAKEVVYDLSLGKYDDPIFTINGRAVNIPPQSDRQNGTYQEKQICSNSPTLAVSIATQASTQASYGRLPLYFIQNDGQMDERVKFYEKGSGHAMYFTEDGVYVQLYKRQESRSGEAENKVGWALSTITAGSEPLSLSNPDVYAAGEKSPLEKGDKWGCENQQPIVVKLVPLGANKHPEIVAEGLQKGKINYFIGNNPEEWRTNIPTYGAVVYKDVYKGIDIKFYGNNRQLEYDIIVRPGADPSHVRFAYEGIEDLQINEDGDLEIIVSNSANCSGCLNGLNTQNCPPLAGVKGVEEQDKNPSVPVPAFLKEGEGQPPGSPFFKGDIRDAGAASFIFDREVGWALPTTPKGSELVAENSKIIQKRPYVYQEIDGKRVEVKGRFVIQDADIHAGSGLQPNGVNLSYLPQKSPLEKGDKGGCSNQIILNLMTLGVRPKPMNVLNPDVYTTGKVLDDINDGVQVANLNPQSVEECRHSMSSSFFPFRKKELKSL